MKPSTKWLLAMLVLSVVGSFPIYAQQPFDTIVLQVTAPTTCTSGVPVSNCPVTGYRWERSATATGTFAAVGTSTATTFTVTSAAVGQNCYRAIATSAKGDSGPSNVFCKTITPPSGPPSPPTNLTVIEPIAFNIRMEGHNVVLAQTIGKARLGATCGKQCFDGYCPVARSNVKLSTPQPTGAVMVARCG